MTRAYEHMRSTMYITRDDNLMSNLDTPEMIKSSGRARSAK